MSDADATGATARTMCETATVIAREAAAAKARRHAASLAFALARRRRQCAIALHASDNPKPRSQDRAAETAAAVLVLSQINNTLREPIMSPLPEPYIVSVDDVLRRMKIIENEC